MGLIYILQVIYNNFFIYFYFIFLLIFFPPKDKGVETYVAEVKVHGEQIDDIAKELNGAKVYLQKFMDSGDESYKELAESELKNASILIKKGYSKLPGITEKQKLKEYEERHNEIMEHLKSM